MADRTGQELGNYRLIRLLGRGGFAEVYLGEHMRLKTQAAIKVLYTQLDSDNSEEFLQEAQTVAYLIHPNIVRIFDFDVKEGVPFLVMDYAPSGTLRQRHPKNTRLSLETIIPTFNRSRTPCNMPTTKSSFTATSSQRTCSSGGAAKSF